MTRLHVSVVYMVAQTNTWVVDLAKRYAVYQSLAKLTVILRDKPSPWDSQTIFS